MPAGAAVFVDLHDVPDLIEGAQGLRKRCPGAAAVLLAHGGGDCFAADPVAAAFIAKLRTEPSA